MRISFCSIMPPFIHLIKTISHYLATTILQLGTPGIPSVFIQHCLATSPVLLARLPAARRWPARRNERPNCPKIKVNEKKGAAATWLSLSLGLGRSRPRYGKELLQRNPRLQINQMAQTFLLFLPGKTGIFCLEGCRGKSLQSSCHN